MGRERAFALLVAQGLAKDKAEATAMVIAGRVRSGTQRVRSSGEFLDAAALLSVSALPQFVSRGGLKLAFALDRFVISMKNRVVLDLGASTGGFTDCALQNGAALVYAVDVGTNQLAYSLRSDPRVVVMEQTNLKDLSLASLAPCPDLVVCDVSFISVRPVFALASGRINEMILLIKPQFEASRKQMQGSGGRCPKQFHPEIIAALVEYAKGHGFSLAGIAESPVLGKEKGNVEYVSWWVAKNG